VKPPRCRLTYQPVFCSPIIPVCTPAAYSLHADRPRQHPVLFYDVSDIRKAHAKIKSSGATSMEEPHVIARMNGREIWIASVSDGQGNVVSLMSDVAEA